MPNNKFFHPLSIFIGTIVAFISALVIYFQWYLSFKNKLYLVAQKFKVDQSIANDTHGLIVMILLTLLLVFLMAAIVIFFIYNEKSNALNKLQKSFIDNFTHELKTPLASLKLYLDTFVKYSLSREEQLKFLSYMEKDVQRLTANVQMILKISELENAKKDYPFSHVDLKDFITKFLLIDQHLFQKHQIRFNSDASERFVVSINEELFQALLMNLITNAMKYSPQNSTIDLNLSTKLGRIVLEVRDYGIGIDKKHIKKIFNKFYRIDGITRDVNRHVVKGTGLGLYFCKQVARIHSAKIEAKSHGANLGSTFIITFPITRRV